MSFSQGLVQGMGLVNAHYDREDRKARADRQELRQTNLDAKADERYQDTLDYREGRDAKADERYQESVDYRKGRDSETDARWQKSFGLQQSQHELSKKNSERQGRVADLQIDTAEEQKANASAIKVLQLWEAGQQPGEEGLAKLNAAGLDPDLLFDPKLGDSIGVAEQVFTGKLSAQSPEALGAMNHVFKTQLSQGVGEKGANGSVITSKQITGIFPADGQRVPKGHVVFEVEVTTEDGKSYRAPLTQNRSTDPNDPVRPIPVEMVARHFRGLQRLQNEPGLKKIYASLGHKTESTDDKWTRLSDNALYNAKDGTVKTVGGAEVKLSDRQKEALKTLRSQYVALSRNIMPDKVEGHPKLMELEAEMQRILQPESDPPPRVDPNVMVEQDAAGLSPDPSRKTPTPSYTSAQQSDIQQVLNANSGWDETKAVAYLKHLNRW